MSFVWYDAFRHSKKTEQCSIHFEKASVLFNLAAILTQQALNADRATDAGRKEAAKFFQVIYAPGCSCRANLTCLLLSTMLDIVPVRCKHILEPLSGQA